VRRVLADADGRTDLVLALVVFAMSVAVYVRAAQLPPPLFDPLGSAAIPQFIAVVLAVLSVAIVVRRYVLLARQPSALTGQAPAAPVDESDGVAAPLQPTIAAAAIVIVFVYVLSMGLGWLGFREATIPFIIALGGALSRFRRSSMMVLIPAAFVLAFALAWLFSDVMYVDLPVTRWLPAWMR